MSLLGRLLGKTPSTLRFSSSSSKKDPPTPSRSQTAVASKSDASPAKPLVVESFSSPTELDKLALPYLSIPLGVCTPPSSAVPTWRERRATMLNADTRLAKRKIIAKEVTRGYFHDFHAIRSHGGKTWRAPKTLIREDRALYFPDISGLSLLDKTRMHTTDLLLGRVSLISILNSKISEEHTRSFSNPLPHPALQHIQINIQENKLKAYLISLFLSSLRAQIPKERQKAYLISQQNLDLVREHIGYHNKHVGYTYLVGPEAKIRWAACGFAEKDELASLMACTGVLLARLAKLRK